MRARHVLLGAGAIIGAPIAAAIGYVYTVGFRVTKTAYRYPMTTAVALTAAGLLWYNGCRDQNVKGAIATGVHTVTQQVQTMMDQRRELDTLERRLADVDARNEALAAQYRAQTELLAQARRAPATPSPPRAASPAPAPAPRAIREDGFYFYYVKPGETLSGIAQDLTGSATAYSMLAQDNRLPDPDRITAGMLLRIRSSLCTRPHPGLFEQVPALEGILLPGGVGIRQRFGPRASEVLELNRALGLAYGEQAPGLDARVVYVPPDHR